MTPERADDQAPSTLPTALDALADLWNVTDDMLAKAGGVSRGTVQNRRQGKGATPRIDELRGYSDFFDLPIDVFEMEATDAVVRAVQEFDFLARKPAKKGRHLRSVNPDAGERETTDDQRFSTSEWTLRTAGQGQRAA